MTKKRIEYVTVESSNQEGIRMVSDEEVSEEGKDEETIVQEIVDSLAYIKHTSQFPVEMIRMWVQFHTVLRKLVENPDYDWKLHFAKPLEVMVRDHPVLESDGHRYCILLDRIQLALRAEKSGSASAKYAKRKDKRQRELEENK